MNDMIKEIHPGEILNEELQNYQPHIKTHATSKEGLAELVSFFKNYKFI